LAFPASSVSGTSTTLDGGGSKFYIDPAYLSTTPIVSSATFNGETLASLGFTTTGLIGTWSLTGTSETIQVYLGNPPAAAVPGPLPLLGIGAAFGWSRRLRKRIAAPLITPSQA
jgi:MYXO-CTERM domain-containing protein